MASAAAAQPPRITPSCDRACLEGYVDRYLDAMLANEISATLFARDVKFTENGIRLPLGSEGLWFGMSGKGKYRFYVPDVEGEPPPGRKSFGRQFHDLWGDGLPGIGSLRR
jgi:hypothetical protein